MDPSVPARFWAKVTRYGPVQPNMDTRCWLWTGGRDRQGYGKFYWDGRTVRAHRASFLLTYGTSPEVVCHRCTNPSCVRPEHLYAGDTETNLIDIMQERIRRDAA